MEKLGIIGCGIMGRAMAKNLLKAGYPLTAYDVSAQALQEVVNAGASPAANPKEVAQASEIIFVMVPNSTHVQEAVMGENGVIEGAKPGTILIDSSSINPYVSQEINAALEARGIEMLDAPVSGGELKAIDGTMSIMVGGKASVLEKVRHILEVIGGSVVLCGGPGAGNITKLANQIIVAANIMVVSEAMVFAKKCGVEPSTVFEAIRGGLAGSTVMDTKVPMMLKGNFEPGGKLKFQLKDANNVLDTGHRAGAPMPLTSMVTEQLQWLCSNGFAEDDHSTMVHYYENLAGVDVRAK